MSSASFNKFYIPSHLGFNGDARNVFQNDLISALSKGRCNFFARVILWECMSKCLYGGDDRKRAKNDARYGCKFGKYLTSNPGPSSTEKSNLKKFTCSRGLKLLHQNICGLISP